MPKGWASVVQYFSHRMNTKDNDLGVILFAEKPNSITFSLDSLNTTGLHLVLRRKCDL